MPAWTVADLSLRQKVGQLFVVGFDGPDVTPQLESLLTDWGIGGVLYFARNLSTPSQTEALSASLQRLAAEANLPPLLVAIDQEGGPVTRIPWGANPPSAMAIGATGREALAAEAGAAIADELRALGINLNFAPVLDVNVNPENPVIGIRSFGDNPALVGRFGSQFAEGIQRADVLTCVKHFPGHGDTVSDSHHELPVLPHNRERLDRVELAPFRRAVDAGVDAVMTTHVSFPAVTGVADRPATIAPSVVSGLLRDELGFEGLVVTDCLEMDAIASGIGTVEAAVQAIEAGCDLLTISHTPERQEAAMRAVLDAVRTGRLSEARLDESVERVLAAKRAAAADAGDSPGWELAADRVADVAARTASDSVTLVRDREGTLPLDGTVTVVTFDDADTSAGDGDSEVADLAAAVDSPDCSVIHRTADVTTDDAGTVVVGTTDASADDEQVRFVRELAGSTVRLVVVALSSPYDLRLFPEVPCYLTTYGDSDAAMAALGRVLRGDTSPKGESPVSIGQDSPDSNFG